MEINKLMEELKMYDFKKNSIASFHQKTGIYQKIIKKYLLQYNIPHNCKGVKHPEVRDSSGRFCISQRNLNCIDSPDSLPDKSNQSIDKKPLDDEKKKVVGKVDISKKVSKRTPEEQIAFIQKSLTLGQDQPK